MVISGIILIAAIFLLLLWMMLGFRRARHRFFSHFLIILLIFVALTFTLSLRGHDVSLKTASGVLDAGKIYMSWLGSAFGNFKSITSYAIKMDWGGDNETNSK